MYFCVHKDIALKVVQTINEAACDSFGAALSALLADYPEFLAIHVDIFDKGELKGFDGVTTLEWLEYFFPGQYWVLTGPDWKETKPKRGG